MSARKEQICEVFGKGEFKQISILKDLKSETGEPFFSPKNTALIKELHEKFNGNLENAIYYINSEVLNKSIYFLYGVVIFILVMVILWFTAVKSEEFRTTYEGIFCNKLI